MRRERPSHRLQSPSPSVWKPDRARRRWRHKGAQDPVIQVICHHPPPTWAHVTEQAAWGLSTGQLWSSRGGDAGVTWGERRESSHHRRQASCPEGGAPAHPTQGGPLHVGAVRGSPPGGDPEQSRGRSPPPRYSIWSRVEDRLLAIFTSVAQ